MRTRCSLDEVLAQQGALRLPLVVEGQLGEENIKSMNDEIFLKSQLSSEFTIIHYNKLTIISFFLTMLVESVS